MDEVILVCLSSATDLEKDEYLRLKYKRMVKSIKKVFGAIDSKENKELLDQSITSVVTLSFIRTIIHNLFLRFGLYYWEKDRFLDFMEVIYQANAQKMTPDEEKKHAGLIGIKH